jgi:tripartite-type tricarboxylate transporter receptor subunit TctC
MGNLPPAMGHIKTGRVRALAVTTAQRSPLVPDIPTIAESGLPGFETVAWFGLFAPAGTPRDIVVRIRDEVAKIVQQTEIRERITTLGGEPVGNSPEAFAAIVKSDIAKWKQVAKTANITAD